MLRSGVINECNRASGRWVFVDLGFANAKSSCGLLIDDGDPVELTFAHMAGEVCDFARRSSSPMNLVLEAPLSVAFNAAGNPAGRAPEKRGSETRYWYVGLGCTVMVAATYLVRALLNTRSSCDVRLFEGFASFKPKGSKSSHAGDVLALRSAAWTPGTGGGRIIAPQELKLDASDTIQSAFLVAGMDLGVPPVIVVG